MAEVQLSLNSVDKTYYGKKIEAAVRAVKNLSLQISKGEIVALLGSSGCGKTSTLRMIAGFEDVTGGTIQLSNREIQQLPPAKRNVAMAFEGYSLYPPLTVRDNIAFALKAERISRSESDAKVMEMAKFLEIEEILDRYPSSISAGQQQRASLARALVRKADLYLLDEPMGQLEPQLRSVLRVRLKQYLQEHQMTTVLVTHDQTEANALADRIAVMEDGELQQFETPTQLKHRPANIYVGTFIGEPPMNTFAAQVKPVGKGFQFQLEETGELLDYQAVDFQQSLRDQLIQHKRIVLGLRPHDFKLGKGALQAQVISN
ncbi:MAG: ABC transporter ATP-binding protein, partial [bacterium]